MSKQINYWNQTIESKIREYQEGVDYSFDGEEYHAPNEMEKGRTTRTYRINHPQLKKELFQMLRKNVDIITSLGFKKKAFISEVSNGNNVNDYYCFVSDEFGNRVSFDNSKDNKFPSISLVRFDNKEQERTEFANYYQTAKSRHEEKIKQTSQEPTSLVPPQGVKCWSCYEIISDSDISQGCYRVENKRLDYNNKEEITFFRTFEHLSCKAKHYDPDQRNNYRYCGYWVENWKETRKRTHDYSCQDCLNKFRDEVNANLIYLETWDKQEQEMIAKNQQIVAEIEKRLKELSEVGGYDNCGIRLCCAEHDKDHNHQHQSKDKKSLVAGSHPVTNSVTKVGNPKLNEDKNQSLDISLLIKLLKWMKKEGIDQISLDPVNNQLVVKYDNNTEVVLDDDFFTASQEIKSYFQQNPTQSQLLSRQDLEKQINQQEVKNNSNDWILPAIGISSLVFLILVWIIVRKKSKNQK